MKRAALIVALPLGFACRAEPELLRQDSWDVGPDETDVRSDVDAPEVDADALDSEAATDAPADLSTFSPGPVAPWRLGSKLAAVDHGLEGFLDTFVATGSGLVTVRLRPVSGPPSLVTLGPDVSGAPSLRPMRFGDATVTDWLVRRIEPVGWNYVATVDTVVEIRKGTLRRARARHVHSTAMRNVEVWNLDTGVGRLDAAEARPAADGGHELVQITCGAWFPAQKKKPIAGCESKNRIFFVRDGNWWWDESVATSCAPRDNGWCYPVSPMPPASEFPPTVAP